ncbi:MAG: enoyl-CoA hydratase/isomerase family protein [Lutibacter sp.]|nr:enoyl-CoA hydratase/isomerase family protein [Lutibacter sp.]
MDRGHVEVHIDHKIANVRFGHPLGNSLPSRLLDDLAAAFHRLSAHDQVRVIVLSSEQHRAFCGGASFEELLQVTNQEEGQQFFSGFAKVINAMRVCSKPIVGVVHGKTVGGGVGLAAACDYCLATEQASIKLSELAIGIGPFVIAPAVERKIGLAAFSTLSLEASSWKNAQWALEKGLYAQVFKTVKALNTAVEEMTKNLSEYHAEALYAMKKMFWEGTEHWDELLEERAAVSGALVLSDSVKKTLTKIKKA